MNKKYKITFFILLLAILAVVAGRYLHNANIAVLNPKGPVAAKERNLIVFTLLLTMIVVIPVFVMTIFIAWRYREGNTKAKYSPNLDHNGLAEATWWLIPSIIIAVLSVVTWRSAHSLDPSKQLAGSGQSMTIQVVAMNWKWLFIYPQQNIATVNMVQFPVNTPIDFTITSDAPMNSFWIPQLGGQIYAMAGMTTHMHLEASEPGSYHGSSANISGRGFAGMDFTAKASSPSDFNSWLAGVRQSPNQLTLNQYNQLARPSQNNPVSYYSSEQSNIYGNVLARFMMPGMGGYVQ